MDSNNLIKVKTLGSESTGFFFKSLDEKKSFVITSKHSICNQKNTCNLYMEKEDGCCRACPREFEKSVIQLSRIGNNVDLSIESIYYHKEKDLAIVHVKDSAYEKLIINDKSNSAQYVAFGFNSSQTGITSLVFDTPRIFDNILYYNLYSNPTPNLIEKEHNFQGISGSIIFTNSSSYLTAKALIIHNENHNDFGAENLDDLDFDEINNFFGCQVFDRRLYISQVDELKSISQQYLKMIVNTIESIVLDRSKLYQEFEEKLNQGRFIQITGLSGTGKSVLLRQIIESKVNDYPFLFVKSDQLTVGSSWHEYMKSLGLPSYSIVDWLVAIEAVGGTPIVFIDGIDRISENCKPIIEELSREIFSNTDLTNWKIVTTLRDTGLEPLKVWLGTYLKNVSIQTVDVELLNDDECNTLAQKVPSLQPLLFSTGKVRDIIRRPFFAKVIANLNSNEFSPESELELIEEWWKRGGFNATDQELYERQDLLKNISEIKASNLSNDVKRRDIHPASSLNSLVRDGIVRINTKTSAVNFTHDIFFEWSLLYVLLEEQQEWLTKVESFGQPPLIARVVELLAQREFIDGEWNNHLSNPKFEELRSQWLRAWLLGPVGHPRFLELNEKYTQSLVENEFALLNKLLTWFQAEKTKANPVLLLHSDQLQRAFEYPWPSDVMLWISFLEYIFELIPDLSKSLFPQVLKNFEVWQYFGVHFPSNKITIKLLDIALEWLQELSEDERDASWNQVSNLKAFREALLNIILMSGKSNSNHSASYLNFLLSQKEIPKETYSHIVAFSSKIAQEHPNLLVNLTLKFVLDELPLDKIKREEKEIKNARKYFQELLDKPDEQRTEQEKISIKNRAMFLPQFPYQQIEEGARNNLAIKYESKYFYPSSPLKEPFYSLLNNSEDEGLNLIKTLSNHAIQAWKQLYEIEGRQPISVKLSFPWGEQEFWGNRKEYIWKRPYWVNEALSSAYMVLENWCFNQLDKGREFDELIQKILFGHESIAILSIASVLAFEKLTISKSVFPIVTNFKILELDEFRNQQEMSEPSTTLIAFQRQSGQQKDIETIKQNFNKQCHKINLSCLLRNYFVNPDYKEQVRNKVLNFKNNLPFSFEDEKTDEKIIKFLNKRAEFYSEYVKSENYFYEEISGNYYSFRFNHPYYQRQAESEESKQSSEFLTCSNIATWAEKSLEANSIANGCPLQLAIDFLKNIEEENLYLDACNGDDNLAVFKKMKQSAFSALATMILVFREDRSEDDLKWARNIINQVTQLPYSSYEISCPSASLVFPPKQFLARALANEIIHETGDDATFCHLLYLVISPSHEISLFALQQCCTLFDKKPKYTWSAIYLSFAICKKQLRYRIYNQEKTPEAQKELNEICELIEKYILSEEDWCELPIPDTPWIELDQETIKRNQERSRKIAEAYNQPCYFDENEHTWEKSPFQWDYEFAGKVIKLLPTKLILESCQSYILDFLENCLKWTIEKKEPSWLEKADRLDDKENLYEWNDSLSSALAKVVGILPTNEVQSRFLTPILDMKTEVCWDLLYPFIENYIYYFIYDAEHVPNNALEILTLCLDRFLKAKCFDKNSYRAGEISGWMLPYITKSLMFVSIEENIPSSKRFVNNDWSEIDLILPIVDKYIKTAGWVKDVIFLHLNLCKKAGINYPSSVFADQILALILQDQDLRWDEQIHSSISNVIQNYVDNEKNMPANLRANFLRIIDWLIDKGDRRSSALQQSEFFRNIKGSL